MPYPMQTPRRCREPVADRAVAESDRCLTVVSSQFDAYSFLVPLLFDRCFNPLPGLFPQPLQALAPMQPLAVLPW